MDTNNQLNFEKVNLIIQLAAPIIKKSGSYRIVNSMAPAELVEIEKYFKVEYLYSIKENGVYILSNK